MIQPSGILGEDSLSHAMSQVSIKALEITSLKKQNQDLMDMASVKEGLKKKLEECCKEMEDKKEKLTKQVFGQASLIGAKNLI